MDSTSDYYRLLGVRRDASTAEIKSAYHRLARRYHPDINPGDPAADARLKAINEAAAVLLDPQRRARHDAQLRARHRDITSAPPPLRRRSGRRTMTVGLHLGPIRLSAQLGGVDDLLAELEAGLRAAASDLERESRG
jgi:curved DNA-binding protein CbpA